MKKKYIVSISLFLVLINSSFIFNDYAKRVVRTPEFLMYPSAYADSVLKSLTADERIAQLFMVAAYSEGDKNNQSYVNELIQKYNIGGLIYFKGNPTRTVQCINQNQKLAKTPLMMGIDGEWGVSMRIDSTMIFPHQLTLGAIQNDLTVYEMGQEIARQCKLMGFHVNFAPVVDVNNNPNNPVINDRSFGDDKYNVARLGLAYMRGLQSANIIACAKHFPGHGDTDVDSHTGLPILQHTRARLDTLELVPFKTLINGGVASVMVAHMALPNIDSTSNLPSTLSKKIVTNILKNDLGFGGLVFTDAMNMKGLSASNKPGESDVKALLAGNDVLLFSEDVPLAIAMIKNAVASGVISQQEIDTKVYKILCAKAWVGLNNYKPTSVDYITTTINNSNANLVRKKCYQQSITLVKTDAKSLPLTDLENKQIASVSIGGSGLTDFQKTLSYYTNVSHFQISKQATATQKLQLFAKLKSVNTVIVSLHDMSRKASINWGITEDIIVLIKELKSQFPNLVLVVNGNPYALKYFEDIENIVLTYEDNPLTQSLAAQVLFGAVNPAGRLPVSVSKFFKYGLGHSYSISKNYRLQYGLPEEVNLDGNYLDAKIQELAYKAINNAATPGCQVLVAKDGVVVYQKSFGHFTYEKNTKVSNESIYDIASMTKICGTMLEVMKLEEEGKINLYAPLKTYLPDLDTTNKGNLMLRDLLTHTAGLKAWIPFFKNTMYKGGGLKSEIIRLKSDEDFSIEVAKNLYMNKTYLDTMWRQIKVSDLSGSTNYVYSDLGLIFINKVIEKTSKQPLDVLLNSNFYTCLGTYKTMYNPAKKVDEKSIVPTEFDADWRGQLVQGYVHDPAAAMFGGVQGHAGLFSNCNDVAIIMQMLLNGGTYANRQYLKSETVQKYTMRQCANCRRGFGFDKPDFTPGKSNPCCTAASPETFGHTGFTGTCVWADPKNNILFVFLSNRINPSADNKKLTALDIRSDMQQAVYDAIIK